ncbi:hypothetical protein Sjap_017147 [Stephania japonica]|uniref:PHD-type zinc finger plants domain-containing protein n=1 Tax=Stephania japonica TaxID=461633 RepID=A0AAP0NHZ8_9MAGN
MKLPSESKEGKEGVVADTTNNNNNNNNNNNECCMCGDHGLQHELFQCRLCRFRSQHRYCSNLYPKAELYQICNWCLKKESMSSTTEEEEIENSSSISSSSHNNDCKDKEDRDKNNCKKNNITQSYLKGHGNDLHHRDQIVVANKPIKRHRSSPDHHHHKEHKEGNLIRIPKFGEISQNRITKKVFRGRIQRYKLLEEVCR